MDDMRYLLDDLSPERRQLLELLLAEQGIDFGRLDATLRRQHSFEEQTLAEIWSEVLGVAEIGPEDSFFALGGDSIRVIQVRARAQARGLTVTVQDLFEHQTLGELARVAASRPRQQEAPQVLPFALVASQDRARLPASAEDAYPLATLQLGMIFHSQYSPNSVLYHDVFSYHLNLRLEVETLHQILYTLTASHPILRTSFALSEYSQPLQIVYRDLLFNIEVIDLRQHGEAMQTQEVENWVAAEQQRGFNLGTPPLLRFCIHQLAEQRFMFTLSFHHAILDGWSVASLLTELFSSYVARLNQTASRPEPPTQTLYREYIALEQQAIASEQQRQYWNQRLQHCPSTELPYTTSRQNTLVQTQRTIVIPITAERSNQLKRLANTAGVPIKNVLLAAHMSVLSALLGQSDVVTGLVTNGRPEQAGGEQTLGLFLNTVPFRMQVGNEPWIELVQAAFVAERDLMPYRRYPLAVIQQENGVTFDSYFNFTHFHVYEEIQELSEQLVDLAYDIEHTNFALAARFALNVSDAHIQLFVDYKTQLFDDAQVELITRFYASTLAAMADTPQSQRVYHDNGFATSQAQLIDDFNQPLE